MRPLFVFGVCVLGGCTVPGLAPTTRQGAHCVAGVFCVDGIVTDCAARGLACDDALGCTGRVPGALRCGQAGPERCDVDRTRWDPQAACAASETCFAGQCVDACTLAASEASNVGCAFDAVSTPNSLLSPRFQFGVVLGNAGDVPADVRITRGATDIASVTIEAGSARHVALPYVDEIARSVTGSTRVADGAYHIVSSRPIAAYQYNPLEFRIDPSCVYTGTREDDDCFSFTNDASLLLPTHALGTEYLVGIVSSPEPMDTSFVTVVAHAATQVRVTPTADVTASIDGAMPAHSRGMPFELALDAGDVLTLNAHGTLDGTLVDADVPVLVLAGCDCTYVPAAFGACDHIEEIVLPLASWGTTAVVAAPRSVPDEPYLMRVMSGADDNVVTISGLTHAITLARGEVFETMLTRDVVVDGTAPLLVAQYLVGAQYFDRGRGHALGDPAMGLAPFVAQFRRSYRFAAPDTYVSNFAAVVASRGAEVRLDGVLVGDWAPIADTSFSVSRVPIPSGAHTLDAPTGAGLTLYGLAPYTSYLLPGGLDVEPLR